jgi:hypothetical protein
MAIMKDVIPIKQDHLRWRMLASIVDWNNAKEALKFEATWLPEEVQNQYSYVQRLQSARTEYVDQCRRGYIAMQLMHDLYA